MKQDISKRKDSYISIWNKFIPLNIVENKKG